MTIPLNEYGDCDISAGVPAGFAHIKAKNVGPTAKAMGIAYARAFTGLRKVSRRMGWKPVYEGVVVADFDGARLLERLRERNSGYAKRKAKRQERDTEQFAADIRTAFPRMPANEVQSCARHATLIGSRRVGRSRTAGQPVYLAVVAHIRHEHTDYEALVAEYGGDEHARACARDEVWPDIQATLKKWRPRLAEHIEVRP